MWASTLKASLTKGDESQIFLFLDSYDDYYHHGAEYICDTEEEKDAFHEMRRNCEHLIPRSRELKYAWIKSLQKDDEVDWFDKKYGKFFRGYISKLIYPTGAMDIGVPHAVVKFFGPRYKGTAVDLEGDRILPGGTVVTTPCKRPLLSSKEKKEKTESTSPTPKMKRGSSVVARRTVSNDDGMDSDTISVASSPAPKRQKRSSDGNEATGNESDVFVEHDVRPGPAGLGALEVQSSLHGVPTAMTLTQKRKRPHVRKVSFASEALVVTHPELAKNMLLNTGSAAVAKSGDDESTDASLRADVPKASTDLRKLIATLSPTLLNEDVFVFCKLPAGSSLANYDPLAFFKEKEGITAVVSKSSADFFQLIYEGEGMQCITLLCYSSLEAVGLTATVSQALAANNIPANIVAAFYHDHIFVPKSRVNDALRVLSRLQAEE